MPSRRHTTPKRIAAPKVSGAAFSCLKTARVPIVDVWASYKALSDAGWTQQRIADAKGVDRSQVARRQEYADLPTLILGRFVKNDFLNEGHAREISKLCNFHNLESWLTREAAMLEVIEKVLAKCTKAAPMNCDPTPRAKYA